MDEKDFEGSVVLEYLARIDAVDEFMAAVDSENLQKVTALMQKAGLDEETIKITLHKIMDPYDEA